MLNNIYQLCPPLFALGVLRIDSPSNHNREVYAQDKNFFALHKKQNLYLRTAYSGEFDLEFNITDSLRVPHLQVLVTQFAKGIHQVTPVYRGKSFYYGNDTTDLEILQILVEMERRNGIDAFEWNAFEQSQAKRMNELQSGANCGVIN